MNDSEVVNDEELIYIVFYQHQLKKEGQEDLEDQEQELAFEPIKELGKEGIPQMLLLLQQLMCKLDLNHTVTHSFEAVIVTIFFALALSQNTEVHREEKIALQQIYRNSKSEPITTGINAKNLWIILSACI